MTHQSSTGTSSEMQQCIDECTRCHNVCLATVSHFLELGGKHADPAHIGLLLDCAEICQTSANFMLRGAPPAHLPHLRGHLRRVRGGLRAHGQRR
jgi:hypothetical protein